MIVRVRRDLHSRSRFWIVYPLRPMTINAAERPWTPMFPLSETASRLKRQTGRPNALRTICELLRADCATVRPMIRRAVPGADSAGQRSDWHGAVTARAIKRNLRLKEAVMRRALVIALLCTPPVCWAALRASQPAVQEQSFRAFLQTWEQAQIRFINGDPTLWKQHASHGDDVTILGGFGGEGEKGWKAVGARYDWASSQYRPGHATVKVDYHNIVVSGDFAFTVGVERQQDALIGNQREGVRRALRATQVFRKEAGGWKLVHRHADQMTEIQEPARAPGRE
jgi:ketosteroid isomerase-like protein